MSWGAGRGGRSRRSRWRCGRGPCWSAPTGWTTRRRRPCVGARRRRWGKWRARFVEHRLDGLIDEPRPGAAADDQCRAGRGRGGSTLESTPTNATHWTRTKMAKRSGLSPSTIGESGARSNSPTTRRSWRRSKTCWGSTSTRPRRSCRPGRRRCTRANATTYWGASVHDSGHTMRGKAWHGSWHELWLEAAICGTRTSSPRTYSRR